MNLSTRNDATDNLPWPVTMRFGIVLLSCVLLSLSCGPELTSQMAKHCYLTGLNGLAFYFALEFVANQRARAQAKAAARSAEGRLSHRLRTENVVATSHQDASSKEHSSGDIESAMDSQADFATYVGLSSQPTLSV